MKSLGYITRPAYPHDFGVQYTGFRLILRPSPLVSLLYDICKILTIMYDIVFVWQYLIIAHQNIRLVGAQWKGNWEMEPVLNNWVVLDSDTVYIQSPDGPHLSTVRELKN